jgi:uncharacterized protein involved in exopolysaccharide biosynthesis
MSELIPMEQSEIYLVDMWRVFARQWRWLAAVFVLILLATLAFCLLVSRQWEATAWIQIGQVGFVPAGQDQKVEPLLRVIERLQMEPFEDEILQSAGFPHDAPEAKLYRSSLKVEPLPYANLIRIRLRANTPELAERLAAATVTQLKTAHQGFEATLLNMAHSHLEDLQADLKSVIAERERLQQNAMDANKSSAADRSTSAPVLANMLLISKDSEIRGLQHAKSDLNDRLSPTYTYDTSMPWPIYVPKKQAFPNLALTWGVGILAGILVGAFTALTRDAMLRPTTS